MTSATTASQVPTLETRVARKRLRKSGTPASSPSRSRAPQAPGLTGGTVAPPRAGFVPRFGLRDGRERPPEGLGKDGVLLLRPDRDADRRGRPELAERSHDHPLAQERA